MDFQRYSANLIRLADLDCSLDFSLMDLPAELPADLQTKAEQALKDMQALENGSIANPDEKRMVGHYWLRQPNLAPSPELKNAITQPLKNLRQFAENIHSGKVLTPNGEPFQNLLLIGIGGSALGPQFITDALSDQSKLTTHFIDNTDPDGIARTLQQLDPHLPTTLTIIISKSGGTPETRNGMLEAQAAYQNRGLHFGHHAIAITGENSKLDQYAQAQEFLARFPMEDWVGGRTSIMSTVGLVPMALQHLDIDGFLAGAAAMDEHTRQTNISQNPALKLALAWHLEGHGQGEMDMVVLPYKDQLVLFSKYLQQLVMESLGKKHNLQGHTVHQGLTVYGNKGSTDQHAYVQQLRDGVHNFFATFIEVRKSHHTTVEVEPGTTSADFLQGFLRGTRQALYEEGRHSLTISIAEVTPRTLGALIALFERAVGYYASLIGINAYHQPGVEAGKKAAATFLHTLRQSQDQLTSQPQAAEHIAHTISADPESVYHALVHLAANHQATQHKGPTPADDTFTKA